jgi:hypothetical protein
MRGQALDVVTGEEGIDRAGGHGGHVGHSAGDAGVH